MKKRIWASLLLAGLVLLTVRPAAAAEASRQESIRILFEELVEQEKNGTSMSAEEAAARSQCIDPSCAHVSVDEEGNVTALCPYGQYLLTAAPFMLFSANPVTELELQPGTNTLYRSGTYHVTGGDGSCTLVVTQGRAVSLLLDGALLARLQLSDGSAASLQQINGASLSEIVPVNATLDVSGAVSVQKLSAGSLTLTGSGRLTVGDLNATISGNSTGSVRVVYQSCGAEALRQLQKLTLQLKRQTCKAATVKGCLVRKRGAQPRAPACNLLSCARQRRTVLTADFLLITEHALVRTACVRNKNR